MTILEFQNVNYFSDDKTIINGISLKINKGDYIYIVGPSGGGKSTFLKLCCHLISPTKGNIFYKGKNLLDYNPIELRKEISYTFQTPYLFGDRIVENIEFPFKIRNSQVDYEKVYSLMELFKINKDFLQNEVTNLSGGEKQRIALIRNLLFKPEILLLDEVTSALDKENTEIVEEAISELNKEGVTILWVTHNLEQSRRNGNRIITIENGEIKSEEVLM